MKNYFIDGNNLIFKIKYLEKLARRDKQSAREKLAFMIDNYFIGKGIEVTLHFDGYENLPIKLSKVKIEYSRNDNADTKIKRQIDLSKNPRNLIVVTSDIKDIVKYAQKYGCEVLSSEKFSKLLQDYSNKNNGDEKSEAKISIDESKKWFNV
ncbi:MAG: NYN domain-containing protein [Ignavibacteriaceae bacterium]